MIQTATSVRVSRMILLLGCLSSLKLAAQAPQFMPLEAAKPVLIRAGSENGAHPGPDATASQWDAWVSKADTDVRQRLDAGEEDSLTNLLRFGVTYTREYRIDDEYLAKFGQSSLVNAFAENRANDLIKALSRPNANQGFVEMRRFVEKKGYSAATPAARTKLKKYLLANLARMQKEFLQAHETKENRDQKFDERGISLDSNLWPDYDIHAQLRQLIEQGHVKPKSVRRVAVVGPGLDFVNKQEGVDYYPPQTVQPFAVLDSLLKLGLADAGSIELVTFDISSRVNVHIEAARRNAAAGKPYTVQLPWYSAGRWTPEFHEKFKDYWKSLGEKIGEPVAAIPVPAGVAGFETRALKIRPGIVRLVSPVDMNVVYQRLPLPDDKKFDLIIGTNIFIYYDGFEQMLARANMAPMLKRGGFLLSNNRLADQVTSGLDLIFVTEVPMTPPPVIVDRMYCYQKRE